MECVTVRRGRVVRERVLVVMDHGRMGLDGVRVCWMVGHVGYTVVVYRVARGGWALEGVGLGPGEGVVGSRRPWILVSVVCKMGRARGLLRVIHLIGRGFLADQGDACCGGAPIGGCTPTRVTRSSQSRCSSSSVLSPLWLSSRESEWVKGKRMTEPWEHPPCIIRHSKNLRRSPRRQRTAYIDSMRVHVNRASIERVHHLVLPDMANLSSNYL